MSMHKGNKNGPTHKKIHRILSVYRFTYAAIRFLLVSFPRRLRVSISSRCSAEELASPRLRAREVLSLLFISFRPSAAAAGADDLAAASLAGLFICFPLMRTALIPRSWVKCVALAARSNWNSISVGVFVPQHSSWMSSNEADCEVFRVCRAEKR